MSNNYIIEFVKVGTAIKVTAIDPITGKEATIAGSSSYSREFLTNRAVKKLEYLLKKE